MLPPKKIAPDPDYEVIDFANQQYSNAQQIKSTSKLNERFRVAPPPFNFIHIVHDVFC